MTQGGESREKKRKLEGGSGDGGGVGRGKRKSDCWALLWEVSGRCRDPSKPSCAVPSTLWDSLCHKQLPCPVQDRMKVCSLQHAEDCAQPPGALQLSSLPLWDVVLRDPLSHRASQEQTPNVWVLGASMAPAEFCCRLRLLASRRRLCFDASAHVQQRDQLMLPAKSLVACFFVRLWELAPMAGRYIVS